MGVMDTKALMLAGAAGLLYLWSKRDAAVDPAAPSGPTGPTGPATPPPGGGPGPLPPPTPPSNTPNTPANQSGYAEGTVEYYQWLWGRGAMDVLWKALDARHSPQDRANRVEAIFRAGTKMNPDGWMYYRNQINGAATPQQMEQIIAGLDRTVDMDIKTFIGLLPQAGLSGIADSFGVWG